MKERVTEHSGSFALKSVEGEGFGIYITFPFQQIEAGVTVMIKIMIVDDQPLVREGLGTLLGLRPEIEVVGMAEDGMDALIKRWSFNQTSY